MDRSPFQRDGLIKSIIDLIDVSGLKIDYPKYNRRSTPREIGEDFSDGGYRGRTSETRSYVTETPRHSIRYRGRKSPILIYTDCLTIIRVNRVQFTTHKR